VVQKYGGTSVATAAKIKRVAARIAGQPRRGGVVVVVSAMGDTTDRLTRLAARISKEPPAREMDTLLSAGETVTAPLLAMALNALGVPALSLSGAQAGIRTSHSHTRATILDVDNAVAQGNVSLPGGRVDQSFREATVGVRADITRPSQVAALPLLVPGVSTSQVSVGAGRRMSSPAAHGLSGAPAAAEAVRNAANPLATWPPAATVAAACVPQGSPAPTAGPSVGPPETTTIRINYQAGCDPWTWLADDFLKAEGFTDVKVLNDPALFVDGTAKGASDLDLYFGSALALDLDAGQPLVALAGLHTGCFELWARPGINTFRDLRGKRLVLRQVRRKLPVIARDLAPDRVPLDRQAHERRGEDEPRHREGHRRDAATEANAWRPAALSRAHARIMRYE